MPKPQLGGLPATPTTIAFGDAGSPGTAGQNAALADHRHAAPPNPVTAHAADPDAHHAEDHASRHTASGGGDAIKLDDLAAPDDTTDLDASTSAHGLLPKLSGDTSEYLRGDGAFATPAGGSSDHGALSGLADDDHGQYLRADGSRGLSGTWTPGDGIDMAGGSFRVPGAEIVGANLPARTLAASVDGSGSLLNLYVGVDAANPRRRVLLQGDTPDEPVVHVYTASTTWDKPAADTFSHIVVEVQGGGGGGGGVAGTSANESSVSAGGGGGGYARKLIPASSLSGSYTVTVGAGGSRGAAGNNNGSSGGASSFAGSGVTTVQGNGGAGGEGDGGGVGYNVHDGGDGGTASGGDVTRAGDGGGNAMRTSFAGVTGSRPSYHAHGGGSHFGGARRQPDLDTAGADGRSYGGGGTGCSLNASTTGKAGGDGAAGVVIVTEYYMGVTG